MKMLWMSVSVGCKCRLYEYDKRTAKCTCFNRLVFIKQRRYYFLVLSSRISWANALGLVPASIMLTQMLNVSLSRPVSMSWDISYRISRAWGCWSGLAISFRWWEYMNWRMNITSSILYREREREWSCAEKANRQVTSWSSCRNRPNHNEFHSGEWSIRFTAQNKMSLSPAFTLAANNVAASPTTKQQNSLTHVWGFHSSRIPHR